MKVDDGIIVFSSNGNDNKDVDILCGRTRRGGRRSSFKTNNSSSRSTSNSSISGSDNDIQNKMLSQEWTLV